MHDQKIKAIIETMLFVAGEAVGIDDIAAVLEEDEEKIKRIVADMIREREINESGIKLINLEGKIQLCTNKLYSDYIEKLLQPEKTRVLTQSALETLAIIAYKQPVTRAEIEEIRGVRCNYSLAMLSEKRLIVQLGRKDTLGHPILYGTNDEFLRHFGISRLEELPEIEEA